MITDIVETGPVTISRNSK